MGFDLETREAKIEKWLAYSPYNTLVFSEFESFYRKFKEQDGSTFLKDYPFFCLQYCFSRKSRVSGIKLFSHNQKFTELLGFVFLSPYLDGVSEGFEVLSYIYSSDWINLYKKML